jgi:hypothetical protein
MRVVRNQKIRHTKLDKMAEGLLLCLFSKSVMLDIKSI